MAFQSGAFQSGAFQIVGGTDTPGGGYYGDEKKKRKYTVDYNGQTYVFKSPAAAANFLESIQEEATQKPTRKARKVKVTKATPKVYVDTMPLAELAPNIEALDILRSAMELMRLEQAIQKRMDDDAIALLLLAS